MYENTPLEKSNTTGDGPIRLVHLLPGNDESPIKCSLFSCLLDHQPIDYEALSYTWGDPLETATISVDDVFVSVTKNLATALKHLRYPDKSRTLWIDALCINQQDVVEKSAQVPRMGKIFGHACSTVIFLGADYEQGGDALKLLGEISTWKASELNLKLSNSMTDKELRPLWDALLNLMQRPWFSRAWVVQELAVARHLLFLCGRVEISGDQFGKSFEALYRYRFNAIVPSDLVVSLRHIAYTPIHHMWTTRQQYQSGKGINIGAMDVLYKFRGHLATDPRDKVFSFYKLMKDGPTPDYSRTTMEVYKSIVQSAIDASNDLEILSHHNQGVPSKLELPSWCPDWSVMRGRRMRLWPNGYHVNSDPAAPFRIDGDKLILSAARVDRVRVLARFPSHKFDQDHDLRNELLRLQRDNGFLRGTTDEQQRNFQLLIVAARIRMGDPRLPPQVMNQQSIGSFWDAWMKDDEGDQSDPANKKKLYETALYSALCNRALFVTSTGTLGLADGTVEDNDEIWIFKGGRVPFCIRPQPSEQDAVNGVNIAHGKLVGECYLHSLMGREQPSPSLDNFQAFALL